MPPRSVSGHNGVFRLLLAGAVGLAGCAPPATAEPALSYLGQARLAPGATFAGTVVGGLSAISYDAGCDCYYVISDDRSAQSPARFYTVRLTLSGNGLDDISVIGTQPLLDENGRPFVPLAAGGPPPPDPEGIAVDAARQRLYWSSEGERLPGVLADPWVRIAGLDGRYLGRFDLPANLAMSAQATGSRRNTTLEGLTLAPGGRLLFAAMEGPGYDDGEPPDRDHGALTRITALDVATRTPVAQYAYPLDPAAEPGDTNGLTDLVALSDTEFLVLERAFAAPRAVVRIFRAKIGAATDVLGVPALAGAEVTPMTKTLLTDLSAVAGPVDNLEGITLGPRLPDGRRTVLLVSDDNFAPAQISQFMLLTLD